MASERNNGILIGGKRPEYVHSAQGTGLRRILGLPALVFFGLVYMVPLTMFTTYGVVTEITGGRTASAYLITLAAMLFTAFSYSFMVKKYPIAGSAYSYTSLSFGPCVGFLAGWSLLLDYLFLPMINYLLIGLFLNIAFPMVPAWVFVLAAIGLVTVLAGICVAVAGPIGFIGLIVPHIVRALVGRSPRWELALCAITGAALLVGADTAARLVRWPAETPVGVLTALVGAPVYLLLARRVVRGR